MNPCSEREPFQYRTYIVFESGNEEHSFQVDSDKRAVIEHASASAILTPPLGLMQVILRTTVSEYSASHYLVVHQGIDNQQSKTYSASQQMRLYADPGTEIIMNVISPIGGGSDESEGVWVSISGYYETVQ
jgi:hypothetical protein